MLPVERWRLAGTAFMVIGIFLMLWVLLSKRKRETLMVDRYETKPYERMLQWMRERQREAVQKFGPRATIDKPLPSPGEDPQLLDRAWQAFTEERDKSWREKGEPNAWRAPDRQSVASKAPRE